MKKILIFASMMFMLSAFAAAQDEFPKFELAGMANMVVYDIEKLSNETMWGWGIAGQYNVNKWFGVVAEYTAAHGASGPFDLTNGTQTLHVNELDTRVQTLLFGPRVSYRMKPVTVFGHFLLGAGTNKLDDDLGLFNYKSVTNWDIAYAIGGGLDINLGKHFAVRPIQLDYLFMDSNLPQFTGGTSTQGAFNNLRYQLGGVIKF